MTLDDILQRVSSLCSKLDDDLGAKHGIPGRVRKSFNPGPSSSLGHLTLGLSIHPFSLKPTKMMVIPKEDIKKVYTYLMTEGVIVVKKDTRMPKHPEVPVANLAVMNIMKSLKSRGCVTEEFSWQHHYYCLTDEGILYLRNYLHMPDTVVPSTIAKAAARQPRDVRYEGERRPREDYRRKEVSA